MAEQFSKTVASLLTNATPKLGSPPSSTPPTRPEHPATYAPPSPHPITPYVQPISRHLNLDLEQNQNANSPPHLELRASVTGKILIFNTATNAFTYCTLTAGTDLKDVVLTSPYQQISTVTIGLWERKVDLRDAGVKEREGMVDDVVKNLPIKAIAMRVLGWYRELFVVRNVEEADGVELGENIEGVKEDVGGKEDVDNMQMIEGMEGAMVWKS